MTNEGTKMVRVFDLATGIRDLEAGILTAAPPNAEEISEIALRQAEMADELLVALIDLGEAPLFPLDLDDPQALTEVAYKVIRDHLEG